MNVIAQLEYERAYCDSAVHRFGHYTTWTHPIDFKLIRVLSLRSTTAIQQNSKNNYFITKPITILK